MKKIYIVLMLVLMIFIGTSCISERENHRNALDKAREMVMEDLLDLNENQLNYVRFSQPELFISPLFLRTGVTSQISFNTMVGAPMGNEESLNSYKDQKNSMYYANFVWILPNTNEVIIVSGTARQSLRYFDPLRAVRRPIVFGDHKKYNAIRIVRTYVTQEVVHIYNTRSDDLVADVQSDDHNKAMINRVRFMPPTVIPTRYLPASDCPDDMQEYSMLWRGEYPNDVFCVSLFATPDFGKIDIVEAKIRPRSAIPQVEPIRNFGEIRTEEEQRKALIGE